MRKAKAEQRKHDLPWHECGMMLRLLAHAVQKKGYLPVNALVKACCKQICAPTIQLVGLCMPCLKILQSCL
jgi:hypothetical protein